MAFVSDAQRKHFFANGGGSGCGGLGGGAGFPAIDEDTAYRLNAQRNDDRIYGMYYDEIERGEGASKEAIAAYFRSAQYEQTQVVERDYHAMWAADAAKS